MSEFDIFNLGVNDIETHSNQAEGNKELYKPTADDGKDGIYRALVRFIPNPTNPRKSLVRKWVHWLTDADGNSKMVDSPTTNGEPCVITDAFFKLRNSKSALDQKMSQNLKRREQYFAIIKIIKDPQDPTLNGQYRIFKFGSKIKEKIDEEMQPSFGEPTQVFDLFNGKNFELVISRQGEYNNYDKSKFSSQNTAVEFNGEPLQRSKADMEAFKKELEENAPDLSKYEYKPWDNDTRDFVNRVISQYISNPGGAIDTVANKKPKSTSKVESNQNAEDEDDLFEVETSPKVKSSTSKQVESTDDIDDLDAFLDGLNTTV